MLTVFLLRHASHGLLGRALAGRMPGVSLNARGQREAERLAKRLKKEAIGRLLASPLDRARETAAVLGRGLRLPVVVAEPLNEIDCGEWTGRSFAALADDPRWHAWNEARATSSTPGGEAMAAVQARAMGFLAALGEAGATGGAVAAVTHGDVIKAVVCATMGLSLDRLHSFAVDPASITTLRFRDGAGEVLALNEAAR